MQQLSLAQSLFAAIDGLQFIYWSDLGLGLGMTRGGERIPAPVCAQLGVQRYDNGRPAIQVVDLHTKEVSETLTINIPTRALGHDEFLIRVRAETALKDELLALGVFEETALFESFLRAEYAQRRAGKYAQVWRFARHGDAGYAALQSEWMLRIAKRFDNNMDIVRAQLAARGLERSIAL